MKNKRPILDLCKSLIQHELVLDDIGNSLKSFTNEEKEMFVKALENTVRQRMTIIHLWSKK